MEHSRGVVNKNRNALYWIPTESEWYKAAYYDPSLNGGAGGYWTNATMGNGVHGQHHRQSAPPGELTSMAPTPPGE